MALASPDEMMPDAAAVRMYQRDLEGRFGTPWLGLLGKAPKSTRRQPSSLPTVTPAQAIILRYLDDWGLALTGEIVQGTASSALTVSHLLTHLKGKGLVQSIEQGTRNTMYWCLSEAGHRWADAPPATAGPPISKASAQGRTKRTGPAPRRGQEPPAVYEVPRIYLETGVRWMTEAQVNAEHGPIIPGELDEAQRWAHMADGRIEPVSLQGPIPTRKLPTKAKQRKSSGKRKNAPDPATDPRREQVLGLYTAGVPVYKLSKTCHMEDDTAKAILRAAGVYLEAGGTPGRPSARGRLTAAAVLEILASDEPTTALMDRFKVGATTIRKVRAGTTWRHVGRQNPA